MFANSTSQKFATLKSFVRCKLEESAGGSIKQHLSHRSVNVHTAAYRAKFYFVNLQRAAEGLATIYPPLGP